jgi:DNA-binding response OmpR family regulator
VIPTACSLTLERYLRARGRVVDVSMTMSDARFRAKCLGGTHLMYDVVLLDLILPLVTGKKSS